MDFLLCDTATQLHKWNFHTEDLYSAKLLSADSFWATMPPSKDIDKLRALADDNTYVLTERPKQLELITLSWLNRNFIPIKRNLVVYSSIKRYDCRLLGITKHVDIKF